MRTPQYRRNIAKVGIKYQSINQSIEQENWCRRVLASRHEIYEARLDNY
jgi:hypothetical protein